MEARPLSIEGAWEFIALQFPDERGNLVIWYETDELAAITGQTFDLAKTHHSQSRKGVIRGIHFTLFPPGQAKYVYCPKGRVLDVVVDVRVGSPTFGRWDSVVLDPIDFRCVFVGDGLGHAYAALEDESVVVYLCSTAYAPDREVAVNPLDPALELPWHRDPPPILSPRDRAAPTLAVAAREDRLPLYLNYVHPGGGGSSACSDEPRATRDMTRPSSFF
jgi:dTDP-4-dehydrorhamnose 3,5-epimerase